MNICEMDVLEKCTTGLTTCNLQQILHEAAQLHVNIILGGNVKLILTLALHTISVRASKFG